MKKLILFLLVVLASMSGLAANPPGKLVRLEVINSSGAAVYMKLEGEGTGTFYYLTIAKDDQPTFTILVDAYKRTTWACDGIQSSGKLMMTGNVRLKFVQCGSFPVRRVLHSHDNEIHLIPYPNFGEPTQEKVVYWGGYTYWIWVKETHLHSLIPWDLRVHWFKIPTSVAWRTVRFPLGVWMRYRY